MTFNIGDYIASNKDPNGYGHITETRVDGDGTTRYAVRWNDGTTSHSETADQIRPMPFDVRIDDPDFARTFAYYEEEGRRIAAAKAERETPTAPDLTPIDTVRDGGVLGNDITVGDRVRVYPGGRYGTVAYLGTTSTGKNVVGIAVGNVLLDEPPIEEHHPHDLRKVFPADPALAPGDRIVWTSTGGTDRTGTVLAWAEDTGTWYVDIDAAPAVHADGYRTWFKPDQLVKVEPAPKPDETPMTVAATAGGEVPIVAVYGNGDMRILTIAEIVERCIENLGDIRLAPSRVYVTVGRLGLVEARFDYSYTVNGAGTRETGATASIVLDGDAIAEAVAR